MNRFLKAFARWRRQRTERFLDRSVVALRKRRAGLDARYDFLSRQFNGQTIPLSMMSALAGMKETLAELDFDIHRIETVLHGYRIATTGPQTSQAPSLCPTPPGGY